MNKSESIKVVCRCRPLNGREKNLRQETLEKDPDYEDEQMVPFFIDGDWAGFDQEHPKTGTSISMYTEFPATERSLHTYAFDSIQWMVDQDSCFEYVGLPTCKKFLEGINGTIFAYGQTGSGKSFSMFGKEPKMRDDEGKPLPLDKIETPPVRLQGLIPRCVSYAYSWLLKHKSAIKTQRATVSFYEIYIHDSLRDLLNRGREMQKYEHPIKGVLLFHKSVNRKKFNAEEKRVKENKGATNKYLLTKVQCYSLEDVLRQFAIAQTHRTVKATPMNPHSSRGHCVMIFELFFEMKGGGKRSSQLTFADLAGSETVKKTGATADILQEAKAINASLSVLGRVITSLAMAKGVPPFKDSSLSHCLKDSLAGNCRTTLVVCISPHENNLTETISSLNFAKRCKMIKTKTFKPILLSPKEMKKEIVRLKKIIEQLKAASGGASSGPKGVCITAQYPFDLDESQLKETTEAYKKKVSKAMSKLQEDVTFEVFVDEKDGRERVTITFIESESWPHEECQRVRDALMRVLAQSEDFMEAELEAKDPITEAMYKALQEDKDRLMQETSQLQTSLNESNAENIKYQTQIEQQTSQLSEMREEMEELRKDAFMAGGQGKLKRRSTYVGVDLDGIDDMEEPDENDKKEYHEYMKKQNLKCIQRGSDILKNSKNIDKSVFHQHNEQLQRMTELLDSYFKDYEALQEQLDLNVQNYNILEKNFEQKQNEVLQLQGFVPNDEVKAVASEESYTEEVYDSEADRVKNLWNTLRDKILVKVFDNPKVANFRLRSMVHQLMEQSSYLKQQDEFWLNHGDAPDMALSDTMYQHDEDSWSSDEDELDDMEIFHKMKYWDVYEVIAWLRTVDNGRFAKFGPMFFQQKVDGAKIVNMKEPDLSEAFGLNAQDAQLLKVHVDEMKLSKVKDPDEDMKLILSEFSETEIRSMGSLRLTDPNQLKISDKHEFDLTFADFINLFPDVPRPIAIKVFSCLEDETSNFVSIASIKRFMRVALQEDPDRRHMINVSAYVDYEGVYQAFGEHILVIEGAKAIIAKIRGCLPEQIRDTDIGVTYLKDLSRDDMGMLLHNCPQTTWGHISAFDEFELLYCELEKIVEKRGVRQGQAHWDDVTFAEFEQALDVCGVKIDKKKLDIGFTTIGIDRGFDKTGKFSFIRALNLFRHPMSDTVEIRNAIAKVCSQPLDKEEAKAQHQKRNPSVYSPVYDQSPPTMSMNAGIAHSQFAADMNNNTPPRADPKKIAGVRQKLMMFSIFGSSNTIGFDGLGQCTFETSSALGRKWGCRLNEKLTDGYSAWCADVNNPADDGSHWIVADFGAERILHAVALQGRGDPGMEEWVTRAHVFYRTEKSDWIVCRNPAKKLITLSNSNPNSVMVEPLGKPERCRYVRLVPIKWEGNPSLRWDCLVFEPKR